MKILILGAGRVGASVAENLVSEKNDITIVDTDAERLSYLQERFDLRGVQGDASLPDVLRIAGADDTDLMVACAATDSVNLVACRIAKDIFNIPRRISRIRNYAYSSNIELIKDSFGVDSVISPEDSVTKYLHSLIEFPEALQVVEFGEGRLSLLIVRIGRRSPLINVRLDETGHNLSDMKIRVLELFRNGAPVPLSQQPVIQKNDELVVAIDTQEGKEAIARLQYTSRKVRTVMIAGGGNIGFRLARKLAEDSYNVRILESSKVRCEKLASMLPSKVLVLHGDATDEALLDNENIEEMDTFLAVTNDDEDNIMSSLLAKRLGARKVVALINRKAYGELMEGSLIDIAVSPSQATIGALLRDVRQGAVVAGHRLRWGNAEAIEFEVNGDRKSSQVVGKSIVDLKLPRSAVVAAILREEAVILPEPDTVIEPGDHVVVYASHRHDMRRVEKLFQVSVFFF